MKKIFLLLVSAVLFAGCAGDAVSGGNTVPSTGTAYIAGGTVSGLDGTLILQNNGGDDLTITADGIFAFSTALTDGSPYDVTVGTQPDNQTCAVANGSGKISGADVTDITVACSTNIHTVGGTVSGLDGTVVLQNNAGDDLTITADSPFTFSTAVVDGSVYNVTVKTQPATQTCTVAYGHGTVSGADVANVAVTCSINTYTVGGSVSGLNGALVLQNTGGDDLTITSNGAFTFSTAVAYGSPYAATILTHPVSQDCTVTNGSGIISGAVMDVSANCADKTWTYPASLTDNISPDGLPVYDPQVAMEDNGNAVIVWKQFDGSSYQIFKSEYRSGAWSYPASATDNISPDGQSVDSPQVAMDDNGNAVIVWMQSTGHDSQIFKSEYRNGTWTNPSSPTDNISPDGQSVDSPQVAMDDNGNAVIVWYQSDDTHYQIFKSEYRSGAWSYPASLTDKISPDGQNAYNPQVAMDDNGNAIIVWHQYDGGNYQIFKSEYRGGAWSYPASATDNISPDGQESYSPQVAMDDNGNAVIVWMQSTGHDSQIFKSEYRNGTWTNPSSPTDNISPTGTTAQRPQVAMDNHGNAVIVWYQSDDTHYQIFKSEYRSGSWTNPATTTDNISPAGTDAYDPQIAMDDNGNAVIVWEQYDGANYQIFKSEYRSGSWTNPATTTDNISPDGSPAYNPQVAMDNNGNAVIVWEQSDSTKYQIFKSEYRSGAWTNPASATDNISPDGQTAQRPQVAMDDNGDAILTWYQSDSADNQIFKAEFR